MDKRAIGKARVESLESLLSELLNQDDEVLKKTLDSGLLKYDGTFHLGRLAEMVGFGCEAATFRQNKKLRGKADEALAAIAERRIVPDSPEGGRAPTKQAVGEQNEAKFLEWLSSVGTEKKPAPVSHTGRLYRKALWADYSGQALLYVDRIPTWFNSRPAVKEALNELDVKIVQKSVSTIQMDAESIADDMEDTMTSALIRKLRSKLKAVEEQLVVEREARQKAELAAKQNELLANLVPTGKMPHK